MFNNLGNVDISAHVDFAALRSFAEKNKDIITYPSIPQG